MNFYSISQVRLLQVQLKSALKKNPRTNIKINTRLFLNRGIYTHLRNQPRQRESNS